jgi:hypothetical protein
LRKAAFISELSQNKPLAKTAKKEYEPYSPYKPREGY